MKKKSPKRLLDNEENSSCSVLITCGKPSEDGKMQVEMTCQGDVTLAGYLLSQAAQMFVDQEPEFDENEPIPCTIRLLK